MNGITVSMAIMDFIPVAFFFAAAVLLQRDLYNKMGKGSFAILAAGYILVLMSGIYKAAWKILYATNLCDFKALNYAFFPLQGPGFMLVFISLLYILVRSGKDTKSVKALSVAAVPAVYSSNILFIILATLGSGGMEAVMFIISLKMKKYAASAAFIVSFIFMLAMGYLGAKFDNSSSMHWIAQATNIVSQGSFFLGVLMLHRGGLSKENAF